VRAAGLLVLPAIARGFAVFGYVPEYRLSSVDWEGAVAMTTHLVLWSLVPTSGGGLLQNEKLLGLLTTDSPLVKAIQHNEGRSPRILISLGGGAGRSEQFAEAVSIAKNRKKLAAQIGSLLQTYPLLSGVELDWEVPSSQAHWRNLGRLAREVRAAMPAEAGLGTSKGRPVLAMAYHPSTDSVANFSSLRGKADEGSFVEMFDFCHALAYTSFDRDRQHSTYNMDFQAVTEWESHGLPAQRLTLGMPLFGIKRRGAGESIGYNDIMAEEPSLKSSPSSDRSEDGVYFVGAHSAASKVRFARGRGLGGVVLWELGQDVAASGPDKEASILRAAWSASLDEASLIELAWALAERTGVNEELLFKIGTSILGGYFMLMVMFTSPVRDYGCDWPPRNQQADSDSASSSTATRT
jgi:hypothetical protein